MVDLAKVGLAKLGFGQPWPKLAWPKLVLAKDGLAKVRNLHIRKHCTEVKKFFQEKKNLEKNRNYKRHSPSSVVHSSLLRFSSEQTLCFPEKKRSRRNIASHTRDLTFSKTLDIVNMLKNRCDLCLSIRFSNQFNFSCESMRSCSSMVV